ncbi:hypothetical protein NQ318_013959 [Aromia moschata]|uniref:DNA-directed DNA polymerase n=1 Tax=Aromia moschata TaxID=1265417 RepID=A0AAV8XHP9_9CUCU|nr:hypothetical protein NQ318_013959 [Aromia moschata]
MKLIQTAFKSRIASYRVHSENRYSDYNIFFESIKNKVIHLLSEVIKNNAVKVIMELFGRYILQTQKIVDNKSFNTANKVIDSAADLNDVFYVFVDLMTTQMSEFQKRDSGWELQFIMEEAYDSLATVNVVIAAYVTTQVHLKLYSYLELLGGKVLYYDTDSVIYIARDKSRVRCSNGRVPRRNYRRFRIIRARVFSTRDKEERVVCKVKGISLNYAASQLVNFEIIKSMILEPMSAGPVSIASRNILRTK